MQINDEMIKFKKKQWNSNSTRQENVTDSWSVKKKLTVHTWKNENLLQSTA